MSVPIPAGHPAFRRHLAHGHSFAPGRGKESAFSLTEVCLAIGLVTFCLVALLGLLSAGMRQEKLSSEQSLALEALDAVAADLQMPVNYANLAAPSGSPHYQIAIPAVGGDVTEGFLLLDAQGSKVPASDQAAFKVWYGIRPPTSRYGFYAIYLCAARAASTDGNGTPDTLKAQDFVETLVSVSIL